MWKLFHDLITYIFPIRCIICKQPDFRLCSDCLQTFPKTIETPYPWILSLFHYQNSSVRKSIFALKYKHDALLIDLFGYLCKERLEEYLIEKMSFENRPVILVPIPMTKKRLRVRKKQTSLQLAIAISSKLLLPNTVDNTLITKIIDRQPQREIKNRSERLKNLHNAFRASAADTRALYVLIDDVTTTGATIFECRKALLKAGAQEVLAITVAH